MMTSEPGVVLQSNLLDIGSGSARATPRKVQNLIVRFQAMFFPMDILLVLLIAGSCLGVTMTYLLSRQWWSQRKFCVRMLLLRRHLLIEELEHILFSIYFSFVLDHLMMFFVLLFRR